MLFNFVFPQLQILCFPYTSSSHRKTHQLLHRQSLPHAGENIPKAFISIQHVILLAQMSIVLRLGSANYTI